MKSSKRKSLLGNQNILSQIVSNPNGSNYRRNIEGYLRDIASKGEEIMGLKNEISSKNKEIERLSKEVASGEKYTNVKKNMNIIRCLQIGLYEFIEEIRARYNPKLLDIVNESNRLRFYDNLQGCITIFEQLKLIIRKYLSEKDYEISNIRKKLEDRHGELSMDLKKSQDQINQLLDAQSSFQTERNDLIFQLQELEVNLIKSKVDNESTLDNISTKIESMESLLQDRETEIRSLKEELLKRDNYVNKLQVEVSKITELRSQLQKLETESELKIRMTESHCRSQISHYEKQLMSLKNTKADLSDMTNSHNLIKTQLEAMKHDPNRKPNDKLERQCKQYMNRIEELQLIVQTKDRDLLLQLEKYSSLERKYQTLDAKYTRLKGFVQEKQIKPKPRKLTQKEIEDQVNQNENYIKVLKDTIEKKTNENKTLNKELQQLIKANFMTNAKLITGNMELARTQSELIELKNEINKLHTDSYNNQIIPLEETNLEEILDNDDELRRIVQRIESEKFNASKDKEIEMSRRISYLERANNERPLTGNRYVKSRGLTGIGRSHSAMPVRSMIVRPSGFNQQNSP